MIKIISPNVYTRVLLLVTFLICCIHLIAQEVTDAPYKKFGILAGTNFSNFNFNKGFPPPATPVDASWRSGLTIGFFVNVLLAKNLFLQPEYHYTQRKGEDRSSEVKYSTGYFSLPVLLSYKISSKLAVVAGPQVEILLNAQEQNQGVNKTITHDMEERSIGATVGVELDFYRNFFLSGRYMQGLNHVGIGQREEVKEFKYEVVNLLVGFKF